MRKSRIVIGILVSLLLMLGLAMSGTALAGPPIDGEPDHSTVWNYAIIAATQTGANQVTVSVQAHYCPACNPNPGNQPGCAAFTHGYPGPPPYPSTTHWCGGAVAGRYAAVQLRDSAGTVIGMTKMVLNPTNWPLCSTLQRDIVVNTSEPMVACTWVTVEADIYCSWCGHYYPEPVEIHVKDVIPPEVSCVETVNPHGQNTPGGKSLGKGKGQNPDGFYLITATDIGDPDPQIHIGTACDAMTFAFSSPIVVKFTQAPGADPACKKIGSTKGQAGAVIWHITLPSDPVVKAVDAAGLESICATCLVPPPPK